MLLWWKIDGERSRGEGGGLGIVFEEYATRATQLTWLNFTWLNCWLKVLLTGFIVLIVILFGLCFFLGDVSCWKLCCCRR